MAGLVLVCDMSVSCFLTGGSLITVMANAGGYRTVDEMIREAERDGIPRQILAKINDVIKQAKVKSRHLGQSKKIKTLGPVANSSESAFDVEGKRMTVAEYFEHMAVSKRNYKPLKFPFLPTINVGSNSKPNLIPVELVDVASGQCRSNKMTGDMTAQTIKYAAVRPDERQKFISGPNEGIASILRTDKTAIAYGLDKLSTDAMICNATILPPARIRYGGANNEIDPQLNGSWNTRG